MRSKGIMLRWPGDQPKTWEIIVSLIAMPELNYFCTLCTQMICKTEVSAAMVINTPLAALAGVRELTSGLQFRRWHPCLSTLLNSSQTHTVVLTFCSQQPLTGAITCARATKSRPGTAALHTPFPVIKFNPDFARVGKPPMHTVRGV